MKKVITLLLIFAMSFSLQAFAKPGDAAGNIYSTDIVAYIDGMAIPSYNIGGKTVVVAEELSPYGFDVIWDENTREIKVNTKEIPQNTPAYIPEKAEVSGRVVGTIYESDIVAYVNGMLVESYNIGGRTALVMEDMASYDDEAKRMSRDGNPHRAIGYSVSLMKAKWNEAKRTISLFAIRPGSRIMTDYGEVTVENVSLCDYRNGAYGFQSSEDEDVSNWNGVISYGDDTYISLSDFRKNQIFGTMSVDIGENKLILNADGIREVFHKNASTSGSCYNMLVTLSGKLNINGNVSQTENSNMILYKGDVYVSVKAINSALGKNYVIYK